MKHELWLVVIAFSLLLLLGFKIQRQQRVIYDQQVYMDLGCHGRYQGAE
jgi:hypothetical protein